MKNIKRLLLDFLGGILGGLLFFSIIFGFKLIYSSFDYNSSHNKENVNLAKNIEKYEVLVVGDEEQESITNLPVRVSLGKFKLTAYCSCKKCCGFWANGRPLDENGNDVVIGASGERLCQGVSIAVDPAVIPYDSKVYIDGKEYIAHDCGGAIKGNRIDVYFDNHQDALDFGVQYANVEVEK